MNIHHILTMTDRKEAYLELVKLYLQGDEKARRYIIDYWNFGVSWLYPDQARLACRKGEKHSCEERIVASLVYDAINANSKIDFRESLIAYAVIYHSCLAAGLSPEEIFNKIAILSPPDVKSVMENFIRRCPEDKSLTAFMLLEHCNKDGEIEIRPDWEKSTRPST